MSRVCFQRREAAKGVGCTADIVLPALPHLGLKHIRLGRTLPAFLSPNVANMSVANVLVEAFGLKPIGTPAADIAAMPAAA